MSDWNDVINQYFNGEEKTHQWKKEFPDMESLGIRIPDGFEDISWGNEMAPAFFSKELGLYLSVDYLENEKREFPDSFRYALYKASKDDDGALNLSYDDVFTSDNPDDILNKIDGFSISKIGKKKSNNFNW